jgi:hypothetical protein
VWLAPILAACTASKALVGVGGSGPNDVWAVGGASVEGGGGTPYAFHWDGRAWSSHGGVPSAYLGRVTDFGNAWFAGEATSRCDGATWTRIDPAQPDYSNSVWADGALAVWVVGPAGRASRYDPASAMLLSTPTSGTTSELFDVWGANPFDVWAVGASGTVVHWTDATSWLGTSAAITTSNLHAIWGSAAHDVWAVGDDGTIMHFDGTAWSPVASGTTSYLEGVWGSAANDVWAVGGGAVLHFDGATWSIVHHEGADLRGVWGAARDDVWVVGSDLTVVHWDGARWSSQRLQ